MRVVDSSAWIEWFKDSPTGALLQPLWPVRSETLVPTLVQCELANWAVREMSEDVGDRLIAYTETCVVVPLDTRIALHAAELARLHGLAMADAAVYATALTAGGDCLTCDTHFQGLPNVVFVGKLVA